MNESEVLVNEETFENDYDDEYTLIPYFIEFNITIVWAMQKHKQMVYRYAWPLCLNDDEVQTIDFPHLQHNIVLDGIDRIEETVTVSVDIPGEDYKTITIRLGESKKIDFSANEVRHDDSTFMVGHIDITLKKERFLPTMAEGYIRIQEQLEKKVLFFTKKLQSEQCFIQNPNTLRESDGCSLPISNRTYYPYLISEDHKCIIIAAKENNGENIAYIPVYSDKSNASISEWTDENKKKLSLITLCSLEEAE